MKGVRNRGWGAGLVVALAGLLALTAGQARGAGAEAVRRPAITSFPPVAGCPVPDGFDVESSRLRRVRLALRHKKGLVIVAIGSSTTAGRGASSAQAAWPAQMAAFLDARLGPPAVTVINLARPGQSAAQMAARFQAEVLPRHPDLVIWETGTLDAANQADLNGFQATLLSGIDTLRRGGADVVLMDPQYSPAGAAVIDFAPYVAAMSEVDEIADVVVFHRFELMRFWADERDFDFDAPTPAAATRMADGVYRCIGVLLAETIESASR